ncbi:MAG: hypothetical protein J5I93_15660 [Pirellulaceae bacterium]|nr:hypothetical protein [Pirellulaceae bacterium]
MYHISKGRRRAGVTLLEVVFSIGVVVIGLLGVIALMPLAAKYAEQGVTADRAAYFNRSAVEQFSTRAYVRPDMWIQWFPANESANNSPGFYPLQHPGQTNGVAGFQRTTANSFFSGWWFRSPVSGLTFSPIGGQSFCIDPAFVAANFPPVGNAANAPQRWFPYYEPTLIEPRMARITIRGFPNIPRVPMSLGQAAQAFTSGDALSLQLPRDRSLPPLQLYTSADPGADGEPGRAGVDDDGDSLVDNNSELGWPGSDDIVGQRLAERRLSWFATLVPQVNHSQGGQSATDMYTLSIVVVKDRASSLAVETPFTVPSPTEPASERLLGVTFLGGPEVRLVSRFQYDPSSPVTSEDDERLTAELQLEANQWIMLAGATLTDGAAYRWYRVVNTAAKVVRYDPGPDGAWGRAGVDDDGDGVADNASEASAFGSDDVPETSPLFSAAGPWAYTRTVTVDGADWDRPEWAGIPPVAPTRATIVTGVVSVQERTIRLETSSLWNLGS